MSIATPVAPEVVADEATDRSLQNRRVWIAPLCLCLVAGLHAYRVLTTEQSPWKGGGFGMFSTIDSEQARSVHAWLITDSGEHPLELPSDVAKTVSELRTIPNQAGLSDLANKLAQRQWSDPALAQEQLAAQLRNEPPDRPLTAQRLRELRDQGVSTAVQTTTGNLQPASLAAVPKGETNRQAVPFQAVRVEIWKYEMPVGTNELKNRVLFTAKAPAGETAP
ncbi:hypothetical protein NA78x_000390 [Anatilimnocola sp. NA78]|uniref:hypothetical protein n=1 Tax=Anatilimnocola sp. NA78 TaxID=3415683 RepID=UPI003CE497FA